MHFPFWKHKTFPKKIFIIFHFQLDISHKSSNPPPLPTPKEKYFFLRSAQVTGIPHKYFKNSGNLQTRGSLICLNIQRNWSFPSEIFHPYFLTECLILFIFLPTYTWRKKTLQHRLTYLSNRLSRPLELEGVDSLVGWLSVGGGYGPVTSTTADTHMHTVDHLSCNDMNGILISKVNNEGSVESILWEWFGTSKTIPIKRDFELSGLPITKVSPYLSNKHNYFFWK